MNIQIDWKEITNPPKEKFGWFVVAVLPLNHSGSEHKNKTNLKGDNDWREKFGFTKAWLNNGEWYEPNTTGMRTNNITHLVTHWDYCPKVPVLNSVFISSKQHPFNSKLSTEQIKTIAKKEFDKNPIGNYIDFERGFLKTFDFMGIN